MGTCLALVAVILSSILYIPALIITFIKMLWRRRFKGAFKRFDRQMLAIATGIDQTGNVVCVDLFNLVLINNKGYKFGNRKETISSALGKNQRDGTLTIAGTALCDLLDLIDKDHCFKSIDEIV